ncbi:MAG TPA: P1 family peptidase [Thermoanaerobaculia bacterium]|nr:P1 family peptidase [Thermoanaerobaculia bacterium]
MNVQSRFSLLILLLLGAVAAGAETRPRARDIGLSPGILAPGPLNAITDVAGVRVGHATVVRGEAVRTGVTAVIPHGGNLFREKVPGAVFVGNGFGKLMGSTQIEELGEIESPILLTNTLNVGRVADAAIDYMLALPGNENVRSINIVVGETNDGGLNDIRGRHVGAEDVMRAIGEAKDGPVAEGSVGAGTGTIAFGFKGGIGTSSRRLTEKQGGYTVGVLVQSNFGGVLTIAGAPIGRALDRVRGDGSIMIVIATDAPVDARNLKRMGARAMMGLARTGAAGTNGSGDYAIAFSTVRNPPKLVANDDMSPLFLATIEATEEAIYNSLFKATSVTSSIGKAEALPIPEVTRILREHGAIPADRR